MALPRASTRPPVDGGRPGNPARRRILQAARRLFAQRGYDAVSIGELARAARVNRAMLYYYFKNKRDLYHGAIADVLSVLPALWQKPALREGTPAARLDNFIGAFYAAFARNRDASVLVLRELITGGPASAFIYKEFLIPHIKNALNIMEEGRRRGDFTAGPSSFMAAAVMGGVLLPNLGRVIGKHFLGEVAAELADDGAYVAFYRNYVARGLGVKSRVGKVKSGSRK